MALSPQQSAVVDFMVRGKGSLQLVARAGCGKTFTIMQCVEAIASRRLGEIAILAYNKAIADEIKGKLAKAGVDWRAANASTVHSAGFSAWKKVVGARANDRDFIDEKKVGRIVDALRDQAGGEHNVFGDCRSALLRLVSLGKQNAFGYLADVDSYNDWFDIYDHFSIEDDITEDYAPSAVIAAAQRVYKRSLDLCRETIDYDDMILAPLVFRARFWPKDFVFVDEAQDTNPARRALALAMLKPRTGRMLFVGDDRQAIYGFTGADATAMTMLRVATGAHTLPLNVTYRCPKAVVALAQSIVPDFTAHDDAPAGSVEAVHVDDFDKVELRPTDAILCRNTAPLVTTAYALISKGTGCRVEGRDIGVGLIKLARRWKIVRLDALLNRLTEYQEKETAKLMEKDKEHLVDRLIDQLDCLRVVITKCTKANKHTVSELCAEIEGLFGDSDAPGAQQVVTLSTVHKSKGREWPRVFILGRRRYMPSPYARKEWQQLQEANLEYVAITRAMDTLVDVVVE